MSEQRANLVAAFVDAWNRQDLDAALEFVGEDFEYVNPPNAVEPGTRRGVEAVATVMGKQWEALGEDALLEVERVHHRQDAVVVEAQLSRGMPDSTARVGARAVMRWTFDGDRVIRLEVLGTGPSVATALAEAGID